jgi:hypothetical protein
MNNSANSNIDTNNHEKVNLKREKNKIASRACRLKKKAQHEANKLKLKKKQLKLINFFWLKVV